MSAKFTVAVAYVIEKDGSVLMLRRSPYKDHAPGEWETGSGRVETGESPEDAVHREVREETGLQIEIVGPVDTFHFYRGASREETIGVTFWCRYVGGKLVMCEEHDRAEWLGFDKAIALLGDNGAATAVARIAANVHRALGS
jgi:8-oxo-dGTP diphosphatase